MDSSKFVKDNHSKYYDVEMDKIAVKIRRYLCTRGSRPESRNSHNTNQIDPIEKVIPLRKCNGQTNIHIQNKQEVGRSKKNEKVSELSEIEKQKKTAMEGEIYRGSRLLKLKEEKMKMEKQQLLRKLWEAEEKREMNKTEAELRCQMWVNEQERLNFGRYQVTCTFHQKQNLLKML